MASSQGTTTMARELFWVIGGGQFGRRAVEQLRKTAPTSDIIVIDRVPIRDLPSVAETICADGIAWMSEHFTPEANVQKIIPAIPLHVAADWLTKKLAAEHRSLRSIEIQDAWLPYFPNPIRLSHNRIVVSHANFLCPPDCLEPDVLCTHTQMRRPHEMYNLLERIEIGNFIPLILRSRQFAAGVGGFLPEDLWSLLERARSLPDTPLLIGTACKCHGIVDGLLNTLP